MTPQELYDQIINAIVDLEEDRIDNLTKLVIKDHNQYDIVEVIEKGYSLGIKKVGELFDEGTYFLPELIFGSNLVEEALQQLLPLLQEGEETASLGKVVIATIEGDVHAIGKKIVGTMLTAYGFRVFDLGVEIPAEVIIDKALEENADVIAVSALLTTTMPAQQRVIDVLKERNVREQFKVIFGGAPVTRSWAESAGADGYASNAIEAVVEVKKLLGIETSSK